jgi:hypothetical protein
MSIGAGRSLTRRGFNLGLGGVATAAVAAQGARQSKATDVSALHLNPADELRNYLRIQGDLSGKPAPNAWRGYYIAVPPDENPRIVFDCESCETKKVIQQEDGRYEVWSKVMTIFKDPDSGKVLNGKTFLNPWTGEENLVAPNIIGSRSLYYVGDDGRITSAQFARDTNAAKGENWSAEIDPNMISALTLDWAIMGDNVQMVGQRKYPEVRPIPLAEYGTTTIPLKQLQDRSLERVDSIFGIVFLAPWQGFLKMGDRPGHSVWHCVGSKMKSFDDLSSEYLAQAEQYIPDVLAWGDA